MIDDTQKYFRDGGPVFIVGMNGSGTTMLAECLAKHPDLYIFPYETRILPYYMSNHTSFGDLSKLSARRRLASALGMEHAFWRANDNGPLILTDDELRKPGFSGVVDSIFRHFSADQGKMRWGEKTPMHIQHISLLAKYFPQAYFIHIYRDGRDVAQSFHRRWKKEPRWTIYRWKKILQTGRTQGLNLGQSRYMEISYETLTSSPESHMKTICDFLDLRFKRSVLKSSMRYFDSQNRNSVNEIVQNSGKWRTYFSKKQLFDLEAIAGHYLSQQGYQLVTQPGDIDPPASRLLWWKFCDKMQMAMYYFRMYGFRASCGHFKRVILSSRKQDRTNYY
jgi:hypothetical protein